MNENADQNDEETERWERLLSVDTLRGLTILLMVFVNDLGPAAPSVLLHIEPPNTDGMTLADIVFPFFLFIAGVSIPLATVAAKKRRESVGRILFHVTLRTLGLLVMGIVGVNRSAITSLSPELWGLLSYVAILLAWCIVPKASGSKRNLFLTLKCLGFVGLLALFAVYRREPVATRLMFAGEVEQWTWLRTQWWGILGLIGWAYLVAASAYLLIGNRREWIVVVAGLLMTNFVVAGNGGHFSRIDDKEWLHPVLPAIHGIQWLLESINQYVSLGSQLGSLPAIVMCGVLLGSILHKDSDVRPEQRVRWCLIYALLLFLAGAATDTFAGVNKIAATPTWCFWCSALATLTWAALYWILDVKRWRTWADLIVPAGANPLIAYLMHPIVLFLLSLTGFGTSVRAYASSESGVVVILGSLAMAAVVCLLTAATAKMGMRVRI